MCSHLPTRTSTAARFGAMCVSFCERFSLHPLPLRDEGYLGQISDSDELHLIPFRRKQNCVGPFASLRHCSSSRRRSTFQCWFEKSIENGVWKVTSKRSRNRGLENASGRTAILRKNLCIVIHLNHTLHTCYTVAPRPCWLLCVPCWIDVPHRP